MPTTSYVVTTPTPGVWTEVADQPRLQAQLTNLPAQPSSTMAVKANIAVAGFARSAGSRALEADRPEVDAHVVATLKQAGYLMVGTTNMDELAFGITAQNPHYGPVRLPGHCQHLAGGSSGGSAAAVAEGAVDIALGTDTGGSISIPASHCGIYGLRPSTGRWSNAGITGLSWTRDTPGIFTRTLHELMAIDELLTGQPRAGLQARPLRLGVPGQLLTDLDPHTEAVTQTALRNLKSTVTLVEVDYSAILELIDPVDGPIVGWESRRALASTAARVFGTGPETGLRQLADQVTSPEAADALAAALHHPVSSRMYAAAQRQLLQARKAYGQLMAEHRIDALVFPTTPAPAPRIDSGAIVEHHGDATAVFSLYTRHTIQGTVLGVPMLTVPLPVAEEELPVGLTIQGLAFEDPKLVTIAQRLVPVWSAKPADQCSTLRP